MGSEMCIRDRMYPDGKQSETLAPMFVLTGGSASGRENLAVTPTAGGRFIGPLLLQLQSSTQGASIAYRIEGTDDDTWRLYYEPIRLPTGLTHIRAKAIRIGYKESNEVSAEFIVDAPPT